MLNLFSTPITLPPQNLSDSQIIKRYGSIKQFDLLTARYWASYYNKASTSFNNKTTAGDGGDEVLDIINNFDYFHGIQRNTDFSYLTQAMQNGEAYDVPTPYMPGQEIRKILLFLQGQFLGIAASANPTVSIINEDVKNKITTALKLVEVQRVFEKQLAELEKIDNIKFVSPESPQKSTDEVVKSLVTRFATTLQTDFMKILKSVKDESMTPTDYVRNFTNANVGRRAVVEVMPDGTIEIVPPECFKAISAKDDDFGKYDIARVRYQRMSKDDVLKMGEGNLTFDEKEQIRSGAFANDLWFPAFQARYNYSLFNPIDQFMSVVTVYCLTTLDSKLKIGKDENGDLKIYSVRKNKKGLPVQVLKKITIAANTFVLKSEIVDTIENTYQKGNKLIPLMYCQPNTYYGINQCLVDSLKGKQKELDAINFRVRENYTMDLGTILAINGAKFRDGITPLALYQELKGTRFTVATKTGNVGDEIDREPIITREDVSLMKEITNYIQIKQSLENDINSIANINAIIMGTQTEYVSNKTQMNSSGLATNSIQMVMDEVMQLSADALFMAVEFRKRDIQKDPNNPIYQNLLGEEGINRILDLKETPYAHFSLSVLRRDTLDPQRKQRMMVALEGLMATGQIDFQDWLTVENATIMSELQDAAKYSVEKKRRQKEVELRLQMAQSEANATIAADATVQKQVVDTQGANQRNSKDNITAIVNRMLSEGATQEQVAEFLNGLQSGQGQPQPQQQAPQEMVQ